MDANADQPDSADQPSQREILKDLVTELENAPEDEREQILDRLIDEAIEPSGTSTPPTTDEDGNPLARLDLDDPPEAPDDPLLRVGYALAANLPEHWDQIMFRVTGAADEVRTAVVVLTPDDHSWMPYQHSVDDLIESCLALREAMYEPGRGAWYNAMIMIYRDGTIYPIYHYQMPPFGCWGPRERDLVVRDHDLYPRDPQHLPDWHPTLHQ